MNKTKTLELLNLLITKIDEPLTDNQNFKFVEQIIGRSVPQEARVLINMASELNQFTNIFAGFEIEDITRFISHYQNRMNIQSQSYFSLHCVDSNFVPKKDFAPTYFSEEKLSDGYTEDEELGNLRLVLPIFFLSTSTIILNLGGKNPGELLMQHEDFTFSIFAPSIRAHLDDLVEGLNSGRYKVFGDEVYSHVSFSDSWNDRLKSKRENLAFDEDGEFFEETDT